MGAKKTKKPSGNCYEIRTVADFFNVPAERRALCLSEFALWMKVCEGTDEMLSGLVKSNRTVFGWIDDDKGEAHTRIVTPDGKQIYPEPSRED